MQHIVKVRIKVKMHRFICDEDMKVKTGDKVKVQINNEIDFGEVITIYPFHKDIATEGKIIDTSSNISDENKREMEEKDKEVLSFCQNKCQELALKMSLIKVEHSLDGSKIIIYFTADKRVDFRELVKDLNTFLKHKTRVELWQISSREKAVLIGGIGVCGREVCCRCIGQIPDTVSIKTVKEQSLEINPIKITGICGKLMCCLTYEHCQYKEMRKEFPAIGSSVTVGEKTGVIRSINFLSKKMKVSFPEGAMQEITLDEYLGKETKEPEEQPIDKRVHIVKPRTIRARVQKTGTKKKLVQKTTEPQDKDKKYKKPSPPKTDKKTIPATENKPNTEKKKPDSKDTETTKKPGFKKPWRKRRYPRKNKNPNQSSNPTSSENQKPKKPPQSNIKKEEKKS